MQKEKGGKEKQEEEERKNAIGTTGDEGERNEGKPDGKGRLKKKRKRRGSAGEREISREVRI